MPFGSAFTRSGPVGRNSRNVIGVLGLRHVGCLGACHFSSLRNKPFGSWLILVRTLSDDVFISAYHAHVRDLVGLAALLGETCLGRLVIFLRVLVGFLPIVVGLAL